MEMQMEGEVVQRNLPRRKKNRADLADELEFFTELRNTLMKKKKQTEKQKEKEERFDSSNSYRSLGTQKGLGFVDSRIKVLRKRLGITAGTAHRSPAVSDPTDPSEKHANDPKDLMSSTLEADPISDDDAHDCDDEEEEDEMQWGKPSMEGDQVQRINSVTSKSEVKADAVMESDVQDTVVSEKTDPIPTNTTAKFPIKDDGHDQADADGVDDDHDIDRGKTDQQLAKEAREMAIEKDMFDYYRRGLETAFSWPSIGPGHFLNKTTVSSMHFTHLAPGCIPYGAGIESTVQIISLKLAELKGGFKFPLSVYGVVAARDEVDNNRNLLFFCERSNSQNLTQDDRFLRLIGPSRAVMFKNHVNYEVQLMVKGSTKSQDRRLITKFHQTSCRFGVSSICFENCFCTVDLRVERSLGSVQATILGVRVISGPWPFGHGVRVACSTVSREPVEGTDGEFKYIAKPSSGEIILLLDAKDGTIPLDSYRYLYLSRQVVSVEPNGQLQVDIQAYAPPGVDPAKAQVCFDAQECNMDRRGCCLLGAELEISVAWSLICSNMEAFAAIGCDFQSDEPQVAFTHNLG